MPDQSSDARSVNICNGYWRAIAWVGAKILTVCQYCQGILYFTGDKMVLRGVRYLVKMMSISKQLLAEARSL
ncbi:hypothetical protein [Microcoleus sp. herbarium14]|uniref:hypothetical protein n=1 Tax=Microcoleus sp. herbarium14 TaxID=3055439 RepID=UPI002FCF222D